MKNKNLVSFLAIALFALFSVTLTSCGDESEDPQPPAKTDLEMVQEFVRGTDWSLSLAKVTANGTQYTYNADCNFTGLPAPVQQNLTDYTFSFSETGNNVSWSNNCFSQSATETYTITQTGSVFKMTINGTLNLTFEFIDGVDTIEKSQVKIKRLSTLANGVTEALLTFDSF